VHTVHVDEPEVENLPAGQMLASGLLTDELVGHA
jgi:hypothetical protein